MAFEKTLPTWKNTGIEPPESLKTSGWEAKQKPPAPYFNWLHNKTFEAIQELQEKAADKNEITIQDASTTTKGIVQLTTATDSTSATLVPTASALKAVKDSIPALVDATTARKGVVQLNSTVTSTSTTQAATPSAVKSVNDSLTTHSNSDSAHGIGDKTSLLTTEKSTIVGAVNELFTSANNGKAEIATAITEKGVDASPTDTFTVLADKVGQIVTGKRYAEGIDTSNSTTLTVTNLGFRPRIITWYIGGAYMYHGIFNASISNLNYVKYVSAYSDSDSKYGMGGVTITDSGFSVDMGKSASQVKWFAFE